MKHDWEYKKLKNVCRKGSSNIQQNKIVGIDGEYPVYGASGYVQNVDFYHQEHPYIGIVKDGSGVGRVNKYPAKSSLLGTMQYILPNEGMSLGYLMYCLQSLKLSKFASGAAIPHIYFRDYGECSVPVPALAVQERIVGELDKVREIIEKKKQQVKELDSLAQSIFYDMFGDPVENEKGWEVKKFGEVGELIRGGGFLKSDFVESGVPCIHYGQIHMKFGQFIKEHLTEIPASVAAKSKIASKGDVVIAITSEDVEGSCKCTAWMGDYDIFVGAHAAIYKHNQNPIYVSYYIKSSGFQIAKQKYVHGIKVMEIKPSDISKIDILLPPLSLQQAFAEKVEAIEKQKELITASLKEAERLFDTRMEYWFGE